MQPWTICRRFSARTAPDAAHPGVRPIADTFTRNLCIEPAASLGVPDGSRVSVVAQAEGRILPVFQAAMSQGLVNRPSTVATSDGSTGPEAASLATSPRLLSSTTSATRSGSPAPRSAAS